MIPDRICYSTLIQFCRVILSRMVEPYSSQSSIDPFWSRRVPLVVLSRYFQHAHFIPIVGVGKRGEYLLVHGDLPRQHSFGTTLRFTGPVLADSRQ